MRIVKFRLKADDVSRHRVGIADDETVCDVSDMFSDVDDLLTQVASGEQPASESGHLHRFEDIYFLPPIASSARIFCVGLNYKSHVAETGRKVAEHPSIFPRLHSAQVGHLENILRPVESEQFDFEGELAVVIGQTGRRISKANAMSHIAGFTCFAENSIRDWQRHAAQVTPGKNFDFSGSAGPWVVTKDEAPGLADMTLTTRLNGKVMQHDCPANLMFPVDELISYISAFTALRSGDVIVTGSPEGVGSSRKPPVWMKPGDVLEVDISGIGTLRNTVAQE